MVSAALMMMLMALPGGGPDTVVVCPDGFRQALDPWLRYRAEQGHQCAFLSNTGSLEEIRRQIRQAASGGRLRFVVLVGDAEPGMKDEPALRARCVPVHLAKAEINVLWGSPPHIATDNRYGDLDGDGVPEVAIGRLTADTPAELKQIVAKILAYERSTDFGPWRGRLNFVAGIGGFGLLADMVLDSATRYFLTRNIPAGYRMSMTYASWQSPYCPDPRLFHETTLGRLNEGAWFWVYIGHGYHRGLDRLRVPGRQYPILAAADMHKLNCRHGAPIALFLACYTGAIDARTDCLAEEMLRTPGGPVAVIAGSRVTMPYAMTVLATGLMEECFERRAATLGEALLGAKRKMAKESSEEDEDRAMLDAIAGAISPAPDRLAAERAEHVRLLNLIGDPLLRLRHPRRITLDVPATVPAAARLAVSGSSAIDGRGTVELVVPRDRLTFKPPRRRQYPQTSGALAEFQEIYQRANDRRIASAEVKIENGRFDARLDVPEDARGNCYVRALVEGVGDFALGAAAVRIVKSSSE